MDVEPTIIVPASSDQSELLADILADSFLHDPVMNWVIPNTKLYQPFFHMMAERLFLPHQHVYLEKNGNGAALWLPPGVSFDMPTTPGQMLLILRLVLTRGLKVIPRLQAVQKTMEKYHPREPHYYLQSVGARQAWQGRGIGAALLKQVTPLCDRNQMPAYLESSSEKNLPLYERHGFETFHSENIGGDGPHMWFMLRQPR
jgi:ribosomal protein S18 acetylase RimI-like enzyme